MRRSRHFLRWLGEFQLLAFLIVPLPMVHRRAARAERVRRAALLSCHRRQLSIACPCVAQLAQQEIAYTRTDPLAA